MLNQIFYSYKGKTRLSIRKDHAKLLNTHANSLIEIKEEVKKLTDKIEAFNKDNLVGYVLYQLENY